MEERQKTLEAVKYVVSMSDYMHIERMLTSGCPHELNFEESMESKLKTMGRGNQKTFVQHSEQVAKSINRICANGSVVFSKTTGLSVSNARAAKHAL